MEENNKTVVTVNCGNLSSDSWDLNNLSISKDALISAFNGGITSTSSSIPSKYYSYFSNNTNINPTYEHINGDFYLDNESKEKVLKDLLELDPDTIDIILNLLRNRLEDIVDNPDLIVQINEKDKEISELKEEIAILKGEISSIRSELISTRFRENPYGRGDIMYYNDSSTCCKSSPELTTTVSSISIDDLTLDEKKFKKELNSLLDSNKNAF